MMSSRPRRTAGAGRRPREEGQRGSGRGKHEAAGWTTWIWRRGDGLMGGGDGIMGGGDGAYNRNTVAQDWGDRLKKLQAGDPEGYPHRCTISEGLGHCMDGRDAEGLPWMAQYTRDP